MDRVKAALRLLEASIPSARTAHVQGVLLIDVGLVDLVVFCYLRNPRGILISVVAMPVALIGTFGATYDGAALSSFVLGNVYVCTADN